MKTYRKSRNSMFLLGMRTTTLVTVPLLMLVLVGQPAFATIQVIDFEDLYPGHEVYVGKPLPPGYAGFEWSSDAKWQTSLSDPGTGYEYGTIGHVSMYTAWENNISMGGWQFDFLGAYITAAWNSGQDFTVEGWRSGSLVYSSYNVTSYDGPYWFDFGFYNVDTVWFKPGTNGIDQGLGGSGHHLCIDNITIPEPATVCLLGLGGLALVRRRRR